jgi:hypothetical protein
VGSAGTLGRIVLRIGEDTLVAAIDTRSSGLVLDTAWARRPGVKRFASQYENDYRKFAAVTLEVALGGVTLRHVAARFAPQRGRHDALIGLDVLAAFAPTFDPARGRLLLRKSGRVADDLPGEHVPTLAYGSAVFLIVDNSRIPLGTPDSGRVLGERRWTLNPRRGEIIVEQ